MDLSDKTIERFWGKVLVIPGKCWEWCGSCRGGGEYGQMSIDNKMYRAHRIAWLIEHGCWPAQCVLHHCDNPTCVNPDHLYDGTLQQNAIDRSNRGPLHVNKKLKPQQVLEVKELLSSGTLMQKEIADQFGVSPGAISHINNGSTWSHLRGKTCGNQNI